MKHYKILLIYPEAKQFSGQSEAFRLLAKCLEKINAGTTEALTPAYDRRNAPSRLHLAFYFVALIRTWMRAIFSKTNHHYIIGTIGQTWTGILRDGVTILIYSLVHRSHKAIALHGNLFVNWRKQSAIAIAFTALLNQCDAITVLGKKQALALIRLGVRKRLIHIVPNTCSIQPIDNQSVNTKFSTPATVQILYLSSLISAKGYPEFLEAIEILSESYSKPIQTILCGPLTPSQYDTYFKNKDEAENWINLKISKINLSNSVSIKWIKGANGIRKELLFSDSHIFVFPSRYKVEAQPIVLIEAMASGCDIITSQVGEIRSTVHERSICLEDPSPKNILEAILLRLNNFQDCALSANRGVDVFNKIFSKEVHSENWRNIIKISEILDPVI